MFISFRFFWCQKYPAVKNLRALTLASSGIQLLSFCFALVLKAFVDCNTGTFLSEGSVATAVSVAESRVATRVAESGVSNAGVSTAVAKTIYSVAPQARVTKSGVAVVGISLSISLGLGLSLTLAVVASKTGV